MKIRTYLLLANTLSIGLILVSLFVSYSKMLLTSDQFVWLSIVTAVVGLSSFVLHFFLTRPLEKSILTITEKSKEIAAGSFHVEVPLTGPSEFRMLAKQFNEMSRNLQKSFDQLTSSEASRRDLVANVSHDLRTPLASIQSFVEALQDDVITDQPTFKQYLHTIRLETTRLSELIDDLFELSRLESGTEVFKPVPYPIEDLILEQQSRFNIQLEEKQIDVDVSIPDTLPIVHIMPHKINRVLANLLQNSIQHSPVQGKIQFSVEVLPSSFLKVTLTDHGEGIDPEDQTEIFDRFYRTDKSRTRESGGAGLGLAIAKSIIQMHGGVIGVVSIKGQGSSFWFTLPYF